MIRIIPLVLALLVVPGCCLFAAEPAAFKPGVINHVVFFKLKEPKDAWELERDCDAKIPRIPSVMSYSCGDHLDSARTNVDSDYHVGLYVGFDSIEDYREYLDHPDHIALVEKWKPRWEWIRIYDIVDSK